MALNTVYKVLNNLLVHLVAEHSIVLKDNLVKKTKVGIPGILHTWSWPPADQGSERAPDVCVAKPGEQESYHMKTSSTWLFWFARQKFCRNW